MSATTWKGVVVLALALAAVGLWRLCAPGATARDRGLRPSVPVTVAAAPPEDAEVARFEAPAPARRALAAPAPPREASLMVRLREEEEAAPALAVALARQGNRSFPDGAGAPERASILIHALARLGRSSEARGEAEDMVNRYPDSDWVRGIERFTGAHRRRNLRLDANGALESY